MQKFTFLILFLSCNLSYAQNISSDNYDRKQMNKALSQEILEFRNAVNLPEIEINDVLKLAANHHTTYMTRSTIVSHYQEMNLPRFNNINTPKERIKYFAGDLFEEQNKYAEICLGISVKAAASYQEIAESIIKNIIDSENLALLHNGEVRHMGVDVQNKKNMYFVTIKMGMGYNNIIAFKDDK